MKIKDIKFLPRRIRYLVTRKVTWTDKETGKSETVIESWDTIWAMFGIHSYKWWWVRRWGKMKCDCLRNPLTRRIVLFRYGCEEHASKPDI